MMFISIRSALIATVFASSLLVGCKGEAQIKDSPETLAKLDSCSKNAVQKDKLIKDYEAEIARLELASANAGQIVVDIEGEGVKVRPGKPGGPAPVIDDAVAAAMSQDFLALVNKSRGPIQKCYELALKKNSNIQAKTVSLRINASFAPTGAFSKESSTPSLGDAFDGCMNNVASKWALKPAPAPMSFQANVSLMPS